MVIHVYNNDKIVSKPLSLLPFFHHLLYSFSFSSHLFFSLSPLTTTTTTTTNSSLFSKKLGLDAEGRLVALAWIHGVCAPLLATLAVASATAFSPSDSVGFSIGISGNLPLSALLFVKAVTVFVVFGVLFVEMKPSQCLSRFGCLLCVWEAKHPLPIKSEHARMTQVNGVAP
jgi:hypothetical protein